jgi:hypothetical protein
MNASPNWDWTISSRLRTGVLPADGVAGWAATDAGAGAATGAGIGPPSSSRLTAITCEQTVQRARKPTSGTLAGSIR